jgi:site-specific DNA-cytosine methylase
LGKNWILLNNVAEGYKMVGNAVPCHLAYCLAKAIKTQQSKAQNKAHK